VAVPAELAAALATLTEALEEPGVDVAATLYQLNADAAVAVSSYLGLKVTAAAEGQPVSFAVLRSEIALNQAMTSLRMSLPPSGATDVAAPTPLAPAPMSLVLYARASGAFVDLAADLKWLTGAGPGSFVLDEDLPMSGEASTGLSLTALSTINQAVGVLIGSGYSVPEAHRYLDVLATEVGSDSHAAALGILAEAEHRQLPWHG
jgi:hypothetical protein